MTNINFRFRKGAGSNLDIMFGTVTLKPTLAHSRGTSMVLPAPSTWDIVNGEVLATNVQPTPEPVDGVLEWGYEVTVKDRHGKSYSFLVGVPDSTADVEFVSLPRYFETKPPLFGQGPKGDAGEAATVTVGTVTKGTEASVTNRGTSNDAVLDFVLPKGDKGDRGDGIPLGGSALQVVRKNSANSSTEWVTPTKALVGLDNVDNTSDANKPVSTAQATAIANSTTLSNYSKTPSDAPSTYPNGLSSMLGRVSAGWPQTNPSEQFVNVVTSKPRATSGATAQWCYPFYAVTSQRPMYRVSRTDDTWTDWREIAFTSDISDNTNYINVKSFGAAADGVTDDTSSISAAFNEGRSKGIPVYIPAGRYFIGGSLDISGLTVYGDYKGYYNRSGTTLVGTGTNTILNQASTTLDSITMNISNLRIENAGVGLRVTYSIFSKFQHISVIDASGVGIIVGEIGIIGPIWNIFEQCQASSVNTHALSLGGTDWNNNNIFYNCDFKGVKAVKIQVSGGYGAINNIFRDTEIRGKNTGLFLAGLTQGTKLESCYLECSGPAVEIDATCRDLTLFHNIYGSLKNNNEYGKTSYIYHVSGVAHVKVYGGWVTTGASEEYKNLSFIGSDSPTSLRLHMVDLPTVSAQASGWTMYSGTVNPQPREVTELKVSRSATPRISLEYPDGSRVFDIRRNGSQGGADYGVHFRNEGNIAFVIDNSGRTIFLEDIGSGKIVSATSVSGLKGVLPIRNSSGAIYGYMPIYTSYS